MSQRTNIFISYCHKDKEWLDRLQVHLKPLEKKHHELVIWNDMKIRAGAKWRDEISGALSSCRIAILLVSANFLSPEFITENELPPLLRASEEDGAVVLPLIVSPCRFLRTGSLSQFQAVNDPKNEPLSKLSHADQEEIFDKLAEQIEDMLTQISPETPILSSIKQLQTIPWRLVSELIEEVIGEQQFQTWFRPLKIFQELPGRIVLLAPSPHVMHTIENRFRPAITHATAALQAPNLEIRLMADHSDNAPASFFRFNPRYTFDSFVEGNSNEFALAAAHRIAENPSIGYNPFFVYGPSGLGKTHLLHAIGHQITRTRPHLRILYLVAEEFANDFINSIRFDRMPSFREKMRGIDVLMVDDIQFLATTERTQEEFFHTFNHLYINQCQIILSSDSSPRSIPTLEERLRTRFEWGLIVDIQPPDLETKVAILRRKAAIDGIDLPHDVALLLARLARSNIRELEGLLNRGFAYSSLKGKPISEAVAKEAVRDLMTEYKPNDNN